MRWRRELLTALGLTCAVAALSPAANAAKLPPAPVLATHGSELGPAAADYCPRRKGRPCHLVDEFRRTTPLIYHSGGVLSIKAKRRAFMLGIALDCREGEPTRGGRRRWTVLIIGSECAQGVLDLSYPRDGRRPLRVRYTFNLENHGHCVGDEFAERGGNRFVRIYSHWSAEDDDPYYAENEFFACRLDSGRTLRLGRDYCGDAYSGCDFVDALALAEEKVAYVSGHVNGRYGPDRSSTLTVFDTATWSVQRAIGEAESPAAAVRRRFAAVVLKPNGSVAWVLDRMDYTGTEPYYSQTQEVWKADTTGRRLLDSDPEISAVSLMLNGSTLSWRRGDEVRSAPLY
jgi:hypothetical protein